MQCDQCGNQFLDLLIIREKESKEYDKVQVKEQIWTYICYTCLGYLNQYYKDVELVKESWDCLK